MDLLSDVNLVNYFGKVKEVDNITVAPVLLQKGRTKLALFGLGAVRDERLHRTFHNKQVHMLRPQEDPDQWFNMFVLHQNRYASDVRGVAAGLLICVKCAVSCR